MAFLQALILGKYCRGADEVRRLAHTLSLRTSELRALAGKGEDSARLLYRRMADLDVD